MESHSGFPFSKIDLDKLKLSIIIPCYNEARNIPVLIQKLKTISDSEIEVILVDNGSTDDTKAVLSKKLDNKSPLIKRKQSIQQNFHFPLYTVKIGPMGKVFGADVPTGFCGLSGLGSRNLLAPPP